MNTGVAVIADLVKSREQPDRALAQARVVAALDEANREVPAVQPFAPTVGDEFQALYGSVPAAILSTLLLRLVLPEGLDLRFGIGVGEYRTVSGDVADVIQDGSAWWSARSAIVEGRKRERRTTPGLRTWYVVAPEHYGTTMDAPPQAVTNAYLLGRDQLVTAMDPAFRTRLLGLMRGQTQEALARAEGVSQSAISQSMHRSGAFAVLAGSELFGQELAR
ncbi:SatD family protein [soil metagenome]